MQKENSIPLATLDNFNVGLAGGIFVPWGTEDMIGGKEGNGAGCCCTYSYE